MRWLALMVLAACGPRVSVDGDDASGSGGTQPDSTSTTSTTSTTTSGDPPLTTSPPVTSSSTSGPFTTTDPSTSTAWGGDFILPMDYGDKCMCSTWDQDCPDGSKCAPSGDEDEGVFNCSRCSPVAPDPAQVGEPCIVEGFPTSGVDWCDISLMCWGADPDTLMGECVAMCMGTEDNPVCADSSTFCFLAPDSFLAVCVPPCDPLAPTCADDEGCWPDDEGRWGCLPAGVGITTNNQVSPFCAPGSLDVDAGQVSTCDPTEDLCCTPICDPAAPICPDGLACASFLDVGVCVDP